MLNCQQGKNLLKLVWLALKPLPTIGNPEFASGALFTTDQDGQNHTGLNPG